MVTQEAIDALAHELCFGTSLDTALERLYDVTNRGTKTEWDAVRLTTFRELAAHFLNIAEEATTRGRTT